MIANAKAVAHGIRAMLYVSGESKNGKSSVSCPLKPSDSAPLC